MATVWEDERRARQLLASFRISLVARWNPKGTLAEAKYRGGSLFFVIFMFFSVVMSQEMCTFVPASAHNRAARCAGIASGRSTTYYKASCCALFLAVSKLPLSN